MVEIVVNNQAFKQPSGIAFSSSISFSILFFYFTNLKMKRVTVPCPSTKISAKLMIFSAKSKCLFLIVIAWKSIPLFLMLIRGFPSLSQWTPFFIILLARREFVINRQRCSNGQHLSNLPKVRANCYYFKNFIWKLVKFLWNKTILFLQKVSAAYPLLARTFERFSRGLNLKKIMDQAGAKPEIEFSEAPFLRI